MKVHRNGKPVNDEKKRSKKRFLNRIHENSLVFNPSEIRISLKKKQRSLKIRRFFFFISHQFDWTGLNLVAVRKIDWLNDCTCLRI